MRDILHLIDNYINSVVAYNNFYSEFNRLYFGSPNPSVFTEKESDFLNEINEELFFVGDDPIDQQSRKDGYTGAKEFREWLKEYKQKNIHFWKEGCTK